MPIVKRKLSKSAWILLILVVLVPIIAVVLHLVGVWDLSFIGEAFMGYVTWQAADGMNAVLGAIGWIVLGIAIFYVLKTYIWGTQIPVTTYPQPSYTPGGIAPSPQQTEEETVVS